MRLPAPLCAIVLSVAFPVSALAQCEVGRFGPSDQAIHTATLSQGWSAVAGSGPVVGVYRERPHGFEEVTSFSVPGWIMFHNVTTANWKNTVVAGNQEYGSGFEGGVWVHEESNGWKPEQLIPADSEAYDSLGSGVAIHGDTILVGGTMSVYDVGACGPGKAYIFERVAGQWVETAAFYPHSFSNPMIMYGVALDTDGQTAVIGASWDDGSGGGVGAVYVYERDANGWHEEAKLYTSDVSTGNKSGHSVAVDGDLLLVGNETGKVFVFERDANGWNETMVLQASDAEFEDRFGSSVSIEGSRAVIGANGVDDDSFNGGAFYVLERQASGKWLETAKIGIDDAPPYAAYGTGIHLEGDRALIVGTWSSGPARLFELGDDKGVNYCGPANLNSTGLSAVLVGEGCNVALANNLTLRASQLPPDKTGYALVGPSQAFKPFIGGSQGNLCLGGGIGRLVKQVKNSGSQGAIEIQVDLTNLPTPGGSHSVLAGENWNFQVWFRDLNPIPTSNFTDGLSVTFE